MATSQIDRNTGLSSATAVKAPVKAATTANIALTGAQTIDTVAVTEPDRVLVKNQTDGKQNGIYIVSTGTWERSPDFKTNEDALEGTQVRVNEGTNAGIFILTTSDPIVIDTSTITWTPEGSVSGLLQSALNLSDVASAIASIDNIMTQGSDVPTASILDLDSVTGQIINLTGTVTVPTVTLGSGTLRIARAVAAFQLTASSSLIVNGSASTNYTTSANDLLIFLGAPSSVVYVWAIQDPGTIPPTTIGLQSTWIPAGAFVPQITNGPSAAVRELATNDAPLLTLNFDPSTDEYAVYEWTLPPKWNAGTITFKAEWTAASGSGTASWGLQAVAISNDDALDAAYGTAVVVTDTLTAVDDRCVADESSAVTIAGTPAKGDLVRFRVFRDTSADTLAVDAELKGVTLFYTVDAAVDS
jgi:hypothetical protein